MSSGGCSRGPVKVVIINTQYVETDATSFKSVVQKLTGKDSDQLATVGAKVERKRHDKGGFEVPSAGGPGRPFLMRDVSFKEFDRFLSQLPPINDLWAD
ncbi:VQ motif-containing protein 1 [Spatholobus suberectus]|nr:VQ motif-containing protein 1 [Spatholobus suberectus]